MDDIYFSTLFAFDWPRLGIKFIKSIIHLLLQAEGCRVARKQRYDHRVSFHDSWRKYFIRSPTGVFKKQNEKDNGSGSLFHIQYLYINRTYCVGKFLYLMLKVCPSGSNPMRNIKWKSFPYNYLLPPKKINEITLMPPHKVTIAKIADKPSGCNLGTHQLKETEQDQNTGGIMGWLGPDLRKTSLRYISGNQKD